jgi:hypothetical protein
MPPGPVNQAGDGMMEGGQTKPTAICHVSLDINECIAALEMMHGPNPITEQWGNDGLTKRLSTGVWVFELSKREVAASRPNTAQNPICTHPKFIRGDHIFNLPMDGVAVSFGLQRLFTDRARSVTFDYHKRRAIFVLNYIRRSQLFSNIDRDSIDLNHTILDAALMAWDVELVRIHENDFRFVSSQRISELLLPGKDVDLSLVIQWTGDTV